MKDNTIAWINLQSHTLTGIAIRWSNIANSLLVYDLTTKELYTNSIYKIDEHNTTKNYFNIHYDGGMFIF